MINVLHFERGAALTDAAAINLIHPLVQALYNAGAGTFGGNGWANNASSSAVVVDAVYTPLDGISASTIRGINIIGSSAADQLPPDTSLCFTLRSLERGRSRRGRCYWGAFTETSSNALGRADQAVLTAYLTHWNGFVAACLAANCALVVASYKNSDAVEVSTVDANNVWDRQRRRAV